MIRLFQKSGSFGLLLAVILSAPNGWAQSAEKPVSSSIGTSLQSIPNPAQWTVTFSYPSERPKNGQPAGPAPASLGSQPRSVVTTRVNGATHVETTDVTGRKTDFWANGNTQYIKNEATKVWLQNVASGTSFGGLSPSGYSGLDWITKGSYIGTIKYAGRACLVFIPNAPPGVNLIDPNAFDKLVESSPKMAFVDNDSHYPVEVHDTGVYEFFQFSGTPPTTISFPEDLMAQIKAGQQERARLFAPIPKPY